MHASGCTQFFPKRPTLFSKSTRLPPPRTAEWSGETQVRGFEVVAVPQKCPGRRLATGDAVPQHTSCSPEHPTAGAPSTIAPSTMPIPTPQKPTEKVFLGILFLLPHLLLSRRRASLPDFGRADRPLP
ncbi:hypothetical protein PVAP13_2NG270306 [Panicum virgatum]|uniref:Uncharacterized protein n=1 Tax=Panicum virgatum TaxID=38727 RepID=A0A8T0VE18_PANVG|nr:hypothetical protein PVAP13_2NG270306 [Panicum virgatum]